MTGPRDRRAFLRTGGLALSAGFAGCVGGLGDDTGDVQDSTTTESETPPTQNATRTTDANSETTTAEPPLAVEDVRVQSSFLRMTTPDSADVSAPEETQFVFADVRVTESAAPAPPQDAFSLAVDDRRFEGTLVPGAARNRWDLYWQGPTYDPDERETGWVAFEVPDPLDADDAALTYEFEGRTFSESLNDESIESFAEPSAEFELVGFDYPDSVERYESFDVSVGVENVGEGDGVFRAVLNQTHPTYAPYPVEVTVPGGERREWAKTFSLRVPEGADIAAAFRLLTPDESREAEIGVAHETTEGT